MDLRLYARVVWRFRWIVAAGLIVAFALAFLSLARVKLDGVVPQASYRDPTVWQSNAQLLITQRGFAEGYTNPYESVVPSRASQTGLAPRFSDPNRFSYLATYYATLASGDAVQAIMNKEGHANGSIAATPLYLQQNIPLPVINVSGSSTSPRRAQAVTYQGIEAIRTFINRQQVANGIPEDKRVLLSILRRPSGASVASHPKITKAIFVYLVVMVAVMGLVFILENLRPRVRPMTEVTRLPGAEATRRGA